MKRKLSPYASKQKINAVESFRWMVEEYKISIFAQELGTAFPVSAKRLKQRVEEINRMV